jgi:murein DD-endopeptidase MepM/ murein hydrolase activator NlpD
MEDEMKQKKHNSIRKQKSYLTASVIAMVAVIAMAGIYNRDKSSEEAADQEAVVMAENERVESVADNEDESANGQTEDTSLDAMQAEETTQAEDDMLVGEISPTEETDISQEIVETFEQVEEPEMHFSETDSIGWPVDGDVILNYSMDKTVYFATLDQYKYNPAIVISGEVNDKVVAAADGQVISVDTSAEIGETVTIELGDEYQTIYGQLKEVEVSAGDFVSRGDVIGYISEPTKYYAVEGSNLYFAMIKSGSPINPMDYFE